MENAEDAESKGKLPDHFFIEIMFSATFSGGLVFGREKFIRVSFHSLLLDWASPRF